MTTDLSQLHPEKDFSNPKPVKTWPLWLAVGTAALAASGYAAFRAIPAAVSTPDQDASLTASTEQPSISELEQASDAVFTEGSEAIEAELPPARGDGAPELASAAAVQTSPDEPDSVVAMTATGETKPVQPARVGAYYLQVASYRTKERADTHASELGANAQSVAYGGPEAGWWHAVRMGPFETRAAAEARRFDLKVQERRGAYVLPRSNGKFHVQVASFAEREQAEQIAKRFTADGHATKITRVKMSGSYWHCVRIGPFDTREEALGYKKLVADVPGSESTVIPYGPPQTRAD